MMRPVDPPLARTLICRCGALVTVGTACAACGMFALQRRAMPGEMTEDRVREIVREEIDRAPKTFTINYGGPLSASMREQIHDAILNGVNEAIRRGGTLRPAG